MDSQNLSDEIGIELDAQIKGNQLSAYTKHLSKLIELYILEPERYEIDFERICYTVIHKLCSLLDTSSYLIINTNIEAKPHFIDGIFLILRTCLSDAICLYFIVDKHDNPQLSQKRIERIMADHIRYVYLDTETENDKKIIRDKFPQWFDGNNFTKKINKLSTHIMVKEIENLNLQHEAKKAFKMYNEFSKSEHNGLFSFDILHGHFDEKRNMIDKAKIYHAIFRTVISINLAMEIWIDNQDNKHKELIRLSKLLMS